MNYTLLLLVFYFVYPPPLQAAESRKPSCDVREIIRKYIPAQKEFVNSIDGFSYRNPLFSAAPGSTPVLKKRTDAELKKIFDNVKTSLINEISNGTPYNQLHSFQKTMIDRLNFLKLQVQPCIDERRVAFNSMLKSQIELCSRLRTAPEISLVSVLGHEIGHSLDLPNLGCATYKIAKPGARLESYIPANIKSNETENNSSSASSRMDSTFKTSDNEFNLDKFKTDLTISSDASHGISSCVFNTPEKKKVLEILINKGILSQHTEGVPVQWNPLRGVYACMAKEFGWAPPPNTDEQAIAGGYLDFGELSAQIWGSKSAEIFLKNNPDLSKQDTLGIISEFRITQELSKKGIIGKEREFNEIYLSNPSLQKALNCAPSSSQNCMVHFHPHTGYPTESKNKSPEGLRIIKDATK